MRLKWKSVIICHPLIWCGVYLVTGHHRWYVCRYVRKGREIYCLIFIWYTWKVHYINEIQTLYDLALMLEKNASLFLFYAFELTAKSVEKRKWICESDSVQSPFSVVFVSYGNQIVIECTEVFPVIKFAFFNLLSSEPLVRFIFSSSVFIEKACFPFGYKAKSAFESNRWVLLLSFKSIFLIIR